MTLLNRSVSLPEVMLPPDARLVLASAFTIITESGKRNRLKISLFAATRISVEAWALTCPPALRVPLMVTSALPNLTARGNWTSTRLPTSTPKMGLVWMLEAVSRMLPTAVRTASLATSTRASVEKSKFQKSSFTRPGSGPSQRN